MKKILATFCIMLGAANAYAKPTVEQIQKTIPNITNVVNVVETPMKGIYEVSTENSVFFVNDDLSHLIGGAMFDVKTKQNLTQPAIERVNKNITLQKQERDKAIVTQLDIRDAIVEKKGTGARIVYVFTDPLCPFCHKLEGELDKMTNITIYRFVVPMKGKQSVAQSTSVWCSKDKLASWKEALVGKTLLPATCETPHDRNIFTARALKVQGTPTLFKLNGSRKDGAGSKDELETWLAE